MILRMTSSFSAYWETVVIANLKPIFFILLALRKGALTFQCLDFEELQSSTEDVYVHASQLQCSLIKGKKLIVFTVLSDRYNTALIQN